MKLYVICNSGELLYPIAFKNKEKAEKTLEMSDRHKNDGTYIDKIEIVDEIINLDIMFP